MNSENKSLNADRLSQGATLAEYHHRLSTQIFFITFFIGLCLAGLEAAFLHKLFSEVPLKIKLAGIVDLVASIVFLFFLIRQLLLHKAKITATDRGLIVNLSVFRSRTLFIPWNKILGARMAEVRLQMAWKMKYLILAVEPGFPLPKKGTSMFPTAENELVVDINYLTRKPLNLVAEILEFLKQFSGAK